MELAVVEPGNKKWGTVGWNWELVRYWYVGLRRLEIRQEAWVNRLGQDVG